jgi:hypothetical protein
MNEEDKKVLEEINKNYWLNGSAEAEEGDIFAGLENSEMINNITVVNNEYELWKCLKNYQGTFKFKNLYFANHYSYGCFVYIVKNGEVKEFEHITFSKYENFRGWIKKVLEINEKTKTVEDFYNTYYK